MRGATCEQVGVFFDQCNGGRNALRRVPGLSQEVHRRREPRRSAADPGVQLQHHQRGVQAGGGQLCQAVPAGQVRE